MEDGTLKTVKAKKVREGDFIPGLDNAYVYEDAEQNNGYLTYPSVSGGYSAAMSDETTLISFHTAEGDEGYLIVPSDMPMTVERG